MNIKQARKYLLMSPFRFHTAVWYFLKPNKYTDFFDKWKFCWHEFNEEKINCYLDKLKDVFDVKKLEKDYLTITQANLILNTILYRIQNDTIINWDSYFDIMNDYLSDKNIKYFLDCLQLFKEDIETVIWLNYYNIMRLYFSSLNYYNQAFLIKDFAIILDQIKNWNLKYFQTHPSFKTHLKVLIVYLINLLSLYNRKRKITHFWNKAIINLNNDDYLKMLYKWLHKSLFYKFEISSKDSNETLTLYFQNDTRQNFIKTFHSEDLKEDQWTYSPRFLKEKFEDFLLFLNTIN